jgi:TRAP-type C4-dicarboxylate transport system permease small subunit
MRSLYALWMAKLYWFCIWLAGISIIVMSIVIPWGVYTRYVLGSGSAWPEPLAILLMIVFTFAGGAACYRANAHIAVELFVNYMPKPFQRVVLGLVDLLMALLAIFMVAWGFELVATTWYQVIGEFPWLSVGITYAPLPIGSLITLLFIIERVWCGEPKDLIEAHDVVADAPEAD